MPAPIPVDQQFTAEQKSDIVRLWSEGETQTTLAAKYGVPRRTMMKLCDRLGLKRTPKEVAALIDLKSEFDTPENIAKLREFRNSHSLLELADMIGSSTNAVDRLCTKYQIKLDKQLYAAVQSERMQAAWTPEKRAMLSGSEYPQLNDREWLVEQYHTKDLSMGQIATMAGVPMSAISHHLKRHKIKLKTKEQYLSKLRRESAHKTVVKTRFGDFAVQSMAEAKFLESLPESVVSVKVEPYTFTHGTAQYVPDFEVDGELVEIKPPEYAIKPGVDRQRVVKQKLVANHNGRDFKCWYYKGFNKNGGFYDIEPINDEDKYFCLNWKLVFSNDSDCYEFLVGYGFQALRWNKDKLLIALNKMFKADGDNKLNANYPSVDVVNFVTNFNDHYWSSTHKNYNPVRMAFELGNRVVLRDAIKTLWETKSEINIYNLVRLIARKYKDFASVSVFKPWVARHIYESLLPNGGTIVDPCMGWGGRLLGTLDSKYNYIGYDLNPNVIIAHEKIKKFVGSRLPQAEFNLGDASKIDWPKGDLLFTSPPYDDTEIYYGLECQCANSDPIYENIMTFSGLIAINLPLRHQQRCIAIAARHGRQLINEFKMRTANFMGRETTYEPILVFK